MKNQFILFCFALLVAACGRSPVEKSDKSITDSLVYNFVKGHQVLLTNEAEFKGHTGLYGASAFLINYNGKSYAVTARHLIGKDGGVDPEINPDELTSYLMSWKMYPRVSIEPEHDTVKIAKERMDYGSSDKDILLLPIENKAFNICALEPEFVLPVYGDKLFLIGCPYSEEECKQNVYELRYDSYDRKSGLLIFVMKEKLVMAGFSGAPIINSKGKVIGAVRGGGEENGVTFVVATFIKEIQNIN